MKKLSNILTSILERTIVFILAVLCLIVFINVLGRFFSISFVWTVEVTRFLFVYLIVFSAIIALKDNTHFKVDLVLKSLPIKLQQTVDILSNLLMLFILCTFFVGSLNVTKLNTNNVDPIVGIPYSYLYGIGIVCSFFMGMILLFKLYKGLFKSKKGGE